MKVKNILIVRQHNQLGDMLCSVPLFEAIRKKYPDSHITLVASPVNYEILFSDINPYIDEVIIYNKSGGKAIYEFIRKLRRKKYDLGFVPSTVSISRTSHIINFLSGAKVRIGVKSIDGKKNKSEYLLSVKKDFQWDEKKLHQIERNLDIGRLVGCDLPVKERIIKIHLSEDEKKFAEDYINKNFPDKNRLIFGFHTGAGKIPNRWDSEKFAELITSLYRKYNNYIFITSGTIDKEVTEKVSELLNKSKTEHIILTNTPVRKVGGVISKSNLFVTNDTGIMHVAGGVGANVVSLFGPTNGFEWAPFGENNKYIKSKTENINDISVEEVLNECELLINKIRKNN